MGRIAVWYRQSFDLIWQDKAYLAVVVIVWIALVSAGIAYPHACKELQDAIIQNIVDNAHVNEPVIIFFSIFLHNTLGELITLLLAPTLLDTADYSYWRPFALSLSKGERFVLRQAQHERG